MSLQSNFYPLPVVKGTTAGTYAEGNDPRIVGAVQGAASSASDVLGVSGANITGVDANADRIIFWDDSASALKHLTVGSGLSLTDTTLTATGGGVTTGSVDNAILRADGTGGSTSQSSDLVIDDAVVPFNITGDAGTDIITAVGHNFTANQGVRFPTLTGGAGLTAATTNYFVRDISGNTFKVSTTSGGAAVNFTTNITAGTVIAMQANVAIRNNSSETNSALVLTPKGNGALILGARPDGTTTGGNPRGNFAVDLQIERSGATAVASGANSFACGKNNTVSGANSFVGGENSSVSGAASLAFGNGATTSSNDTFAIGRSANASGGFCLGFFSSSTGDSSMAFGSRVLSNRFGQLSHSGGQFATQGDAQSARFTLRCKTTTNAAVEMALDGSTTYLTIPSGKVMFCNIKVVGSRSDGVTVATYERQYAAKNVAGTSSEVFSAVTIGTDNAAGTSLEIATVDAGDYIRIRPTGIASETWRWVAVVDAVEVGYGT